MVAATPDLPPLPALVVGRVGHRRRHPLRHGFSYRVYQWLVDLDDLPRLPWYLRPLARFDARDHLGEGGPGTDDLKDKVIRFAAAQGVRLGTDARVVMLANARSLGHVFDPLTVFWCLAADGVLRCIVAEVHNTYGERHAYLLEVDAEGRAQTRKEFYVSPFNDVSGTYALRFELLPSRVRVLVSLERGGERVFDAVLDGTPEPATRRAVVRRAVTMPAMTYKVSALIRMQGIRLWLRRLPVQKRPAHMSQEGL